VLTRLPHTSFYLIHWCITHIGYYIFKLLYNLKMAWV